MANLSLAETAIEIKKWAKKNRLFGNHPINLAVDDALIRAIFGRVGIPQSINILQNRVVSFIGVDPEKGRIIIFLERALTRAQESTLITLATAHGGQQYDIVFREGSIPHVGGKTLSPITAPFEEYKGRYSCGSSIYIASEKGAGTMGCLVRDAAGTLYGLSNSHVTAGSNYAELNLPILAPGAADVQPGGRDPATIGHHSHACPLIDGNPEVVDATKNLDAALFKIAEPDKVTSFQRKHHDTPIVTLEPKVGLRVEKTGRTTGRTFGTIVAMLPDAEAVRFDVDIIGGRKLVHFHNTFVVEGDPNTAFSLPGDSGSLITYKDHEDKQYAVGLLFAGDGNVTFAVPINEVLAYFAVELVGGHNV